MGNASKKADAFNASFGDPGCYTISLTTYFTSGAAHASVVVDVGGVCSQ